jgi:Ca2+/Na+ antiporter
VVETVVIVVIVLGVAALSIFIFLAQIFEDGPREGFKIIAFVAIAMLTVYILVLAAKAILTSGPSY